MKKSIFLLTAAAVTVVGCGTRYEARPKGFFGRMFQKTGYTDQQIDEDMFIVTFTSKAGTSPQANLRRAMYRAAELSLEKRYNYFKVIGNQALGRADGNGYNYPVTNLTIKCFDQKPNDDAVVNAEKYISLNSTDSIKDHE